MKKSNTFPILITFDTDSDDFQNQRFNEQELSWKGISQGIFKIKSSLQDIKDSFGNTPKFTWFVRADNVISDTYGDSNYILKRFKKIWETCEITGDEIAWHPHLQKKNNKNDWVQETDSIKLKEMIFSTFQKFKEINFSPKSVRVGGTFGSNELNQYFHELNIKCNSSVFPGRKFEFDTCVVSWLKSPQNAFFPDIQNYSESGDKNYNTLQVPLTVLPIKTLYDKRNYTRYLDLTFKHSLIKKGFSKILLNIDFIVTISHPNIIINQLNGIKHELLCFEINNLYKNLAFIIYECKKYNLTTQFMTMNEFYEQY